MTEVCKENSMFTPGLSTIPILLYGYLTAQTSFANGQYGSLSGSKIILILKLNCRFFQYFITFSILLNSVCLSIFDYSDRQSTKRWNQVIDRIDQVLTIIFILEAFLKIIGMGFVIHRRSYLREGWNVIDFLIAISG